MKVVKTRIKIGTLLYTLVGVFAISACTGIANTSGIIGSSSSSSGGSSSSSGGSSSSSSGGSSSSSSGSSSEPGNPQEYSSTDGLDVILGEEYNNTYKTVACSADTYVLNGTNTSNDSVDINYGSEATLLVKGYSSKTNKQNRIIYLKFDISGLSNVDFEFGKLILTCSSLGGATRATTLNLYSCASTTWDENEITYNNKPVQGEFISTVQVTSTGQVMFDIADYLKSAISNGESTVTFVVVNEPDTASGEANQKLTFYSKEGNDSSSAPRLKLYSGDKFFTTAINYTDEDINPWTYAMKEVNDYLTRKELIFANQDKEAYTPDVIDEEYSLSVDVAKRADTKGDDTVYTSYPTRNISTLSNYEYNNNETSNYDIYGGYNDGSSFSANGFYQISNDNGRYWGVSPTGNKFYRTAVNSINTGDQYIIETLKNKYSTVENFFDTAIDRVKNGLYFNTAGSWSDIDNIKVTGKNISYTGLCKFASGYGTSKGLNNSVSGSTTFVGGVMPVFDPQFETYCDQRVNDYVTLYKDDVDLYGYFLDNELPHDLKMLDNFMAVDGSDKNNIYSYAVAYTYLYKVLGTAEFTSADITDELRNDFRAMVYERYFNVGVNAIKKVDNNHLILGARFLKNCYTNREVLKVAGYYCDAISFNYYSAWTPDATLLNNIYIYSGKPFLITEWYSKGMDACTEESGLTNTSGAGWTVRTQADRGKFYQNYALRLMECPYCIGYDYFKYWDNNPANLDADTSNTSSNKGIYNIKHEEYTDCTSYMEELNKNKYSLISYFDARTSEE